MHLELQLLQATHLACTSASGLSLPAAQLLADLVFNISLRWKFRHIRGPFPQPLLGNLAELRKLGGVHLAHTAWSEKYGKAFRMFLGRTGVVVLTGNCLAEVSVHWNC